VPACSGQPPQLVTPCYRPERKRDLSNGSPFHGVDCFGLAAYQDKTDHLPSPPFFGRGSSSLSIPSPLEVPTPSFPESTPDGRSGSDNDRVPRLLRAGMPPALRNRFRRWSQGSPL